MMSAPFRRHLLLVPILIAHAALLALIVVARGPAAEARSGGRSITAFDLPAPTARPAVAQVATIVPPAPPLLVPIAIETPAMTITPPLLSITDPAAAAGGGCDLAGEVQRALRADPAVSHALAGLPREARSVANAVMLWDGRWIDGRDAPSQRALARIRDVVLQIVAQAPGICRVEGQSGPSLMIVPGQPDTVVALGSGQWRWDDVFLSAPVAGAERSATAGQAVSPGPAI